VNSAEIVPEAQRIELTWCAEGEAAGFSDISNSAEAAAYDGRLRRSVV
jgi:hypothetical protein